MIKTFIHLVTTNILSVEHLSHKPFDQEMVQKVIHSTDVFKNTQPCDIQEYSGLKSIKHEPSTYAWSPSGLKRVLLTHYYLPNYMGLQTEQGELSFYALVSTLIVAERKQESRALFSTCKFLVD